MIPRYAVIYTTEERSRWRRWLRRLLRREPRGEVVWAGPVNDGSTAMVVSYDASGVFSIDEEPTK